MPFYLRRGQNFGPLRFNFSKGGIGVSVGVKGARVGVGPRRGPYVHVGREGVYYRKTLGKPLRPMKRTGKPRDGADTASTVPSDDPFGSHEGIAHTIGPSRRLSPWWYFMLAVAAILILVGH